MDLTDTQKTWLRAVLSNDENSTDAELVEYFIENGLTAEQAADVVAVRDSFLGQITGGAF